MKSPIKLLNCAVCRVPAFPSTIALDEAWDSLKEMIRDSSPNFYDEIKFLNAKDLGQIDEKISFTIFKYFNRAKNRPTPFGQLASISSVSIADSRKEESLMLGPQINHRYLDWSNVKWFEKKKENQRGDGGIFQTNSTIYVHSDRIKYIYFNENRFELSSIEYSELIFAILEYARKSRNIGELTNFLKSRGSFNMPEANSLVKMLADLQLLISDIRPNIIGNDYFERQKFRSHDNYPSYIIAERKLLYGNLEKADFHELQQSFEWLIKALPVKIHKNLDNFKKQFIQKFGMQEVSLALALDPEIGIGYANLETDQTENELVAAIKELCVNDLPESSICWIELNQFLLKAIVKGGVIQLDSFEPAKSSEQLMPNTFSVIVRVGNDGLVVERLGGCTANALLGRFSLIGGEFNEMGQMIAGIEAEANPEVIFFDIGYMAERRVDNVNRRKSLYQAELPILTYCLANIHLQMDDIMIRVIDEEIIIRSKIHNRRLIPRIASAYNYVRSDLSLFRFLADLQHQGIRSSFTFDFMALIPGLDHYPRVHYKSVVMSPAKWLIPSEFIHKKLAISESTIIALKKWLSENSIEVFSCGVADQKLVFKADSNDDLNSFLRFVSGRTVIYIDEYIKPKDSHVIDQNYDTFSAEFNLVYYHENPVYQSVFKPSAHSVSQPEKFYLQGQEWVYFEIYTHNASSESVLSEYLKPFLVRNRQKISLWFFIRYNSPSSHIRLRFKLKSVSDGYSLIAELSGCLKPLLLNRIISDLQLRIYWPEAERYEADLMPLVENFFWQDSKLSLAAIDSQYTNNQRYFLSMRLMEAILDKLTYDHQRRIRFLAKVADSFAVEFNMSAPAFRRVNEGFKQFVKINSDQSIEIIPRRVFDRCINAMTKALNAAEIEKREKLVIDLFHMHVNRLYSNDQRIHELIIYNYLCSTSKRNYFISKNALL
ncbi:thiopeptide-type bacteriocin biosynthesis protein [Mucilaginibacter frigoritolerans]|uniref:Thiopeptide-type bacteriocin biosynthesis protein n=1 Tax=Mucilaginibacter frigoritolerans TaxID=652788 RepID=A0A562TMF2_9SPHI|nr:lantibiotic dehydratase [Mucilaginibacter frigoritolerans]TWI94583.1 thiopeptide-type bacteriocin biosynthesis protein [Mucilaginibacter frigoritolerans]